MILEAENFLNDPTSFMGFKPFKSKDISKGKD